MSDCLKVRDLNELRAYVEHTLCHQNELEPKAFQMTERILLRGGRPCGMYFCLHGPRSVKFVAIWENEQNTVLFYGSTGERVHRSKLVGTPALMAAA